MYNIHSATEVRKNWSEFCDMAEYEKPGFVKRTRDKYVFLSYEMLLNMLSDAHFSAKEYKEDDGSFTLSLDQIDLVVNAHTHDAALQELGNDILEYSNEYYDNFQSYYHSKNRHAHFPYVMKSLLINDASQIGKEIECQAGKN